MRIKNLELWSAFLVIALVTIFYVQTVTTSTIPSASGFVGHSLGVIGFILMLMTEILYSLRKRYQFARWGKLQHWLSFHIFTGIVGPYLVLLHTSWKFNGLAGILMLFTVLIVASGFVGRYFYTAVPRSADGIELDAEETAIQIIGLEKKIKHWLTTHANGNTPDDSLKYYRRSFRLPFKKQKDLDGSSGLSSEIIEEYRHMASHYELLRRQHKNFDRSRRLLAIWHTLHVPLGMGLFFTAFVHILAALYFATFIH